MNSNTKLIVIAGVILVVVLAGGAIYLYHSRKEGYKADDSLALCDSDIVVDAFRKGGYVNIDVSHKGALHNHKLNEICDVAASDPFSPTNPFTKGEVVIKAGNSTFIPAMGTVPTLLSPDMVTAHYDKSQRMFPENFEGHAGWFSVARNQQNCGSCWAFATTEMLEYRIGVATRGDWKRHALKIGDKTGGWLSVQYIISCVRDNNEKGCEGAGILQNVIRHLSEGHRNGNGLYLNAVYPYEEDQNGENTEGGICKHYPGHPRFNYKNYYAVSNPNAPKNSEGLLENIRRIKRELLTKGPVMTSMYVFQSFMDINSTTNTPTKPYSTDVNGKGNMVGGHAVLIVGWGTVPGGDSTNHHDQYWIIRNSWGPEWGSKVQDNGGFWFHRMGDDLAGFQNGTNIMKEFVCVAGEPDLEEPYVKQLVKTGALHSSSSSSGIFVGYGVIYATIAGLFLLSALGFFVFAGVKGVKFPKKKKKS